jgi:hypothetical protein
LHVRQEAIHQEGQRWKWSVWLDGPAEELDDVEAVTYHLHPTFPDPIRTVTDRTTQFRLQAIGWGTFTINLEIHRRSGRSLQRSHHLSFESPDAREARRKEGRAGRRQVFVASSVADRAIVSSLQRILEKEGFTLVTDSDFGPDLPWEVSAERLLRSSDAAIAIVSDLTSTFVEYEIRIARKLNVPILPIWVGHGGAVPEPIRDLEALRVKEASEIVPMAGRLIRGLHDLMQG